MDTPREIRGVLIPITNGRVLLPNATVAEVITLANVEKIANAPEWILGRLSWRGWRLPLFSFAILSGLTHEEGSTGARVAVLKAIGGHAKMPFIAMLTQGFPRLTTVSPELLIPTGDEHHHPHGVRAQVLVRDDQAVIPDLNQIETLMAEALVA
ncbi:MAG: chemotaxis protein CheW [Lysobacterales bacterium 69-70]|uniref:chemotaxis protein CheW n=1 Tax=Tahibacter caeni TaxID=1453545 RepID=UPI00086EDCE6|nr:chemotaxis protein CheW [Tahibacter caeni]MBN8740883.1 chemotaxis protein CheW [Xanthomonadaceae bacterium]ODU35186.1 MAG: chemotaxis protein CheW [Xanthomonadaceae bacterium SCN 69-320]ODV16416.1 MAG: chemotaxis protein CheW [Xanthomonadaceae bacterium SCN 69-25]OJY94085.1 MAG: chemotaxis protein CheW [Xanthomonadales bacterium 69-70]